MSDTKQAASGTAKSGSDRTTVDTATTGTPAPTFVKQAMRNMVRKGSKSLFHFGLTALGFLGFITLVAWLGRPTLPG